MLVYATSWWAAGEVGQYLKAVQEPIWDNLFRQKAELFREVEQIYWGHSAELERLGSWGVGFSGVRF